LLKLISALKLAKEGKIQLNKYDLYQYLLKTLTDSQPKETGTWQKRKFCYRRKRILRLQYKKEERKKAAVFLQLPLKKFGGSFKE
jgi:hypothetical protein